MNIDFLTGPAPESKCVLIVSADMRGIETLRWQKLAAVLVPRDCGAPRMSHHPAEYRAVPAGLFSALFSELVAEHGAVVAISCLHQTADEQVMVCTDRFFGKQVGRYLSNIKRTATMLAAQLRELEELQLTLEILSATGADLLEEEEEDV